MIKVNNIDEEIQKAHDKLSELEAAKKAFFAMTEDKRLAEALHELKCHWDHADECSWFYEVKNDITNWGGHSHSQWLKKAQNCLKVSDYNTIIGIVKLV